MAIQSQRSGAAPRVASWLRAVGFHFYFFVDSIGCSVKGHNPVGILVQNFTGCDPTQCVIIGGTVTDELIAKVQDQGWTIAKVGDKTENPVYIPIKGMYVITTIGKTKTNTVKTTAKVKVPDLI